MSIIIVLLRSYRRRGRKPAAPESQRLSAPASTRSRAAAPPRAIALLALAAFASQAMVRVTDSLLPQIAADFGVTVGAASIVVTAYALAHGSVQLVIGPIGDRFGKYRCVAVAGAVSTVMVLLCGLAPSLPTLVAARLACGLAAGWIIPLALAFIGDVIPYERRQQVLGRFLSGQILGQLFGQAAGGVLGDCFGWRNVFFLLAGAARARGRRALIESCATRSRTRGHATATRSRGFVADYRHRAALAVGAHHDAVASSRAVLCSAPSPIVGADLHLRFGVSFTLVGIVRRRLRHRRADLQPARCARWSTGSARSASPPAAACCSGSPS